MIYTLAYKRKLPGLIPRGDKNLFGIVRKKIHVALSPVNKGAAKSSLFMLLYLF